MSEGNLSPEEIQALLDESADDAGGDSLSATLPLTDEQLETIKELCNISFGAASSSLAVIVSKDVDVPTPEITEHPNVSSFVSPYGEEPATQIVFSYTGGLTYKTVFVTKTKDLQNLATLMMGGEQPPETEGAAAELDEIQISAISEAFSQMMNASATSMASMMGDTIEVSAPELEVYSTDAVVAKASDLGSKAVLAIQFNLEVGDGEVAIPLTQLITTEDTLKQVDKLMSDNSSSNEDAMMAANPSNNIQSDPVTVQPVAFSSFDDQPSVNGEENKNLGLVLDVSLNLTVQLGSTELSIKDILELTRGSVIELDRIAGEAVDLMANGKLIAKGEVVVIEDNFGLRIVNIVSPEDRLRGLTG